MQLSTAAICAVAGLHVGFFVLESVLRTTPAVRRMFGTSEEEALASRVLALNQGVYNLGAAVLLLVFLATANATGALGVLLFLSAMGLVGAATANWRIVFVQTLPALVAALLLYLG